MLKITEHGPDVREVELKGLIEKPDIERLERDLPPFLRGDGPKGLILRIEAWEDMTADAIAEDARFEIAMLPHATALSRVAVVTDKQMVEALLRWIDPIVPSMELRTFASAEVDAARAWAGDPATGKERSDGPGIRVIEDGADSGLMVFEMDGRMSQASVDAVFAAFERTVERHGRIDMVLRVKRYGGFDPAILADVGTLTSKIGAIGKVRRYAVVGAPDWMRSMMEATTPLVPIDIRTFDSDDEADARAWAGAA